MPPFQLQAEDLRYFPGPAADFPSDWVPERGDIGHETDTGLARLGDGVTAWSSLGSFRFTSASETLTAAGAISLYKKTTKLALAGAGAVTLAAPAASMLGEIKLIQMTADNGDVTLALTNVVGQSSGTTATFNDVGDSLTLIAGANSKWIVLKEQGISLA